MGPTFSAFWMPGTNDAKWFSRQEGSTSTSSLSTERAPTCAPRRGGGGEAGRHSRGLHPSFVLTLVFADFSFSCFVSAFTMPPTSFCSTCPGLLLPPTLPRIASPVCRRSSMQVLNTSIWEEEKRRSRRG